MKIVEHLKNVAEQTPEWLRSIRAGDPFDRSAFFGSRVVVYPGSGNDGHAVRTFGKAAAAHCFLHIDYAVPEAVIRRKLAHPVQGFRGYRATILLNVTERELSPSGWVPHLRQDRLDRLVPLLPAVTPYALLAVLDRLDGFDEDHGPATLAVLFLAGDGHASFDALFCQKDSLRAPFAMLLEDHGFGGDYSRWGAGGITNEIAVNRGVLADLLLVGRTTKVWGGYEFVSGVEADPGGMWRKPRRLNKRTSSSQQQSVFGDPSPWDTAARLTRSQRARATLFG